MKIVRVVAATVLLVVAVIGVGSYEPMPQWFNGKVAEIKYDYQLDELLKSELEASVPSGSLHVHGMSVSYRSIFRKETNQYIYFLSNYGDVDVFVKSPLIKCLTGKIKLPLKTGQTVLLSIKHPVSPKEVETDFGIRYEEVGMDFFIESGDSWINKNRAGTTAHFVLPAGAAQ